MRKVTGSGNQSTTERWESLFIGPSQAKTFIHWQKWPKVKRVMCEQLKQLSVGISTTPYIRSLPLPTTSVSLVALDCSISGESEKRTTGRKLSEALSCNPCHFFLWKSLLSLSGSCHLSFNHFVLLCSRNSINILMQSRSGVDPVIGMHLLLNQGYFFFHKTMTKHNHASKRSNLINLKSPMALFVLWSKTLQGLLIQTPPSPLQHSCHSIGRY